MRHRKKTTKLGRTAEHRNALLANQTCSLIEHGRIKTTLAKAKAVRPLAERMITLAKRGGVHARRRALALLHNNSTRTVKAVGKLFSEVAPRSASRQGGYTRVDKARPSFQRLRPDGLHRMGGFGCQRTPGYRKGEEGDQIRGGDQKAFLVTPREKNMRPCQGGRQLSALGFSGVGIAHGQFSPFSDVDAASDFG